MKTTRAPERRPAALHVLACLVLERMVERLTLQGKDGNCRADNRIVLELLIFFVGDALRRAFPTGDLGLQCRFNDPGDKTEMFTPVTVKTVLRHCVEQGWMTPPGGGLNNYRMTEPGLRVVESFKEGRWASAGMSVSWAELDPLLTIIDRETTMTMEDLQGRLFDIARMTLAEDTVVAHYEFDRAWQPVLQAARR